MAFYQQFEYGFTMEEVIELESVDIKNIWWTPLIGAYIREKEIDKEIE